MSEHSYAQKVQKLVTEFKELDGSVGLGKSTSNLFRKRADTPKKRLDVKNFNEVIRVDTKALTVEVEGMTTFENLVDAALAVGTLPLVVPELKTITIGGGVSGLAIESSSFRYGLVHESVVEMDVLLASGKVVKATRDNSYSDLFYAIPNSYGTLGYVLRVVTKVRKAAPYVRLQHIRFDNTKEYFVALEKMLKDQAYKGNRFDFIDGTAFSPTEIYITLGFDSQEAPYTSDYTHTKIYYKSIREREEDYLTTYDYIWRWDTDWFWCSKNVYADRPLMRRVLGKKRLGSRTYGAMMRWEQKNRIIERAQKLTRTHKPAEIVIQDIEVPIANAPKFLEEFDKKIGIRPVWICPTHAATNEWPYPLYPMNPKNQYINFGFWDTVPTAFDPDGGHYNKIVENLVEKLGGMKSLYSASFYDRSRFERLYNYADYRKIKQKYDPTGRFKELYDKAVKAH